MNHTMKPIVSLSLALAMLGLMCGAVLAQEEVTPAVDPPRPAVEPEAAPADAKGPALSDDDQGRRGRGDRGVRKGRRGWGRFGDRMGPMTDRARGRARFGSPRAERYRQFMQQRRGALARRSLFARRFGTGRRGPGFGFERAERTRRFMASRRGGRMGGIRGAFRGRGPGFRSDRFFARRGPGSRAGRAFARRGPGRRFGDAFAGPRFGGRGDDRFGRGRFMGRGRLGQNRFGGPPMAGRFGGRGAIGRERAGARFQRSGQMGRRWMERGPRGRGFQGGRFGGRARMEADRQERREARRERFRAGRGERADQAAPDERRARRFEQLRKRLEERRKAGRQSDVFDPAAFDFGEPM